MRGTKAKRLRREVYGDDSTKAKTTRYVSTFPVVAAGKRRAYQKLKRGT